MDEKTRLKARELLLRARIYRFAALFFAVGGLVVFMVLYFKYIQDGILDALRHPRTIAIVLFPFLPAVFMSWLAKRTEKKFMAALAELAPGQPAPAEKDKKP